MFVGEEGQVDQEGSRIHRIGSNRYPEAASTLSNAAGCSQEFGGLSDKGDLRGFARRGKIGIGGKKATSGMDRVGIGSPGRFQHSLFVHVHLRPVRRTETDRFIGEADM